MSNSQQEPISTEKPGRAIALLPGAVWAEPIVFSPGDIIEWDWANAYVDAEQGERPVHQRMKNRLLDQALSGTG